MNTKAFWLASLERAVKTFAQSLVAIFLADSTLNILNANWEESLAVAGTATLLSFLTSIASAASPFGPAQSPSLVTAPPATADGEKEVSGEPVGRLDEV